MSKTIFGLIIGLLVLSFLGGGCLYIDGKANLFPQPASPVQVELIAEDIPD